VFGFLHQATFSLSAARSARIDVRAADLKEAPTKRIETELILRDSRFVGSDEDGGLSANIAASAASHQTQSLGERSNQTRIARRRAEEEGADMLSVGE